MSREEATKVLIDACWSLKTQISKMNQIAVDWGVFVDDPTLVLNLSCMCDEMLAILERGGRGVCP